MATIDDVYDLLVIVDGKVDTLTTNLTTLEGKVDVMDSIIDAILVDVTGLNGDVMRGTDSAALASVCTEVRLAELGAGNLPADVDTLLTESQSHPTLPEIEASSVLALETSVQAIKTETDKLTFTGSDVHATLDGEIVDTGSDGVALNAERFADFTETTY